MSWRNNVRSEKIFLFFSFEPLFFENFSKMFELQAPASSQGGGGGGAGGGFGGGHNWGQGHRLQ
jgi:uncharacterized membrane protein